MSDDWKDQERKFQYKCVMIYVAYLDKLYEGFMDHYSDGIVDAILTYWNADEINIEHARHCVDGWLIPTLRRIRPDSALIHLGAPLSTVECPHCHQKMSVPQNWKELMEKTK